MRIALIFVTWLVLCGAAAVPPDAARSALWFNTLPTDERFTIQADLILTGDYSALVDAEFGPATFDAIVRFQTRRGDPADGVLLPEALDALKSQADHRYDTLGMTLVKDAKSGLAAYIPVGLLSQVVPSTAGKSFATPDGELKFDTIGFPPASGSLADLRATLTSPDPTRKIGYTSLTPSQLVVSGTWNDHSFYSLFLQSEGALMGYNVSWTERYAAMGPLIATFAASYSVPAKRLPGDPLAPPAPDLTWPGYAAPGLRIGAFVLPDNDPTAIVLDGETGAGLEADFVKALEQRPAATRLLLNSPGGFVADSLRVAHRVADRHLATEVPAGYACFSACAYIYFAGSPRVTVGQLGVHQIYGAGVDLETAQVTLSDVLAALDEFGVSQQVITIMLRTPSEEMHVFTKPEIMSLGIDRGNATASN